MNISLIPCSLSHPNKPRGAAYAGHNSAHIVEVAGYDPKADVRFFSDELARVMRSVALDRSAVVIRVRIPEGKTLVHAHQLALVEAVKSVKRYSGTQAILFQTIDEDRESDLTVHVPGAHFPWDDCWTSSVPRKALKAEKPARQKEPVAV